MKGNLDIDIPNISNNSKKVQKGDMFVAIKGFDFDGHMIPLDLHVSVTKCEEPVIKYNELFAKLHSSIDHNK